MVSYAISSSYCESTLHSRPNSGDSMALREEAAPSQQTISDKLLEMQTGGFRL